MRTYVHASTSLIQNPTTSYYGQISDNQALQCGIEVHIPKHRHVLTHMKVSTSLCSEAHSF